MEKEKLEKANAIIKAIEGLKTHLLKIAHFGASANRDVVIYNNATVIIAPGKLEHRTLRNDFLPVTPESFMHIYIINVKAEIERLEKEFESL
jgi:hypothetical protein